MAITVNRGGATANQWYETGINARSYIDLGDVKLRFDLDSKGGGTTEVQVNIPPASFQELIDAMLDCDYESTVKAFSKALIANQKTG